MSLLGSLVVLKEQVRKAQAVAMPKDVETTRLLVDMELSLLNEINRVSINEKAKGNNVGITKIDTYS
ncbi:MAG: hypothetical protein JHC33_03050 [Ignisphaera sp.]|nr:hypothetical protein [Ignisphaera sp.]